ncbi:MAG: hypothetical protein ACLRZ7_02580 [Lachnospiraceae bacterium]
MRLKIIQKSAIVVLFAILILAVPFNVDALQNKQEASIPIDVTYGINNQIKGGSLIPITISISSSYEGFTGTVSILAPARVTENYLYTKEVNVTANGYETTFYLPLIYQTSTFLIQLMDVNNNICGTQTLNLNFSLDQKVYIGVITDGFDQYEQWTDLPFSDSDVFQMTYSAFHIDPASLPDETAGLDLYDIIIIDNYNTSHLSQDQIQLLLTWMKEGHYLILCTGKDTASLGGFTQVLPEITLGESVARNYDFPVTSDDIIQDYTSITCNYMPIHSLTSNVLFSYENDAIIQELPYGNGQLQLSSISLGDLTPIFLDNYSYSIEFWQSVIKESYIYEIASNIYGGKFTDSAVTTNIANQEQLDHIPQLRNYVIILIIYVGVAIPILYQLLKRKDKLHYIRLSIGVMAVSFSIIIILLGSKTRFSEPFSNYIAIDQLQDTKISTTIFAGMQAPYNKDFSFEINKDYFLTPLFYSNIWDSTMSGKITNEYTVSITEQKNSIQLDFQNLVAFSPRFFELEKEMENVENRKIDGTINYFDDNLSGVITNKTGKDLIHTFIYFNKKMVYIGSLRNNETINLNNYAAQTFINFDLDRLNELMGSSHKSSQTYNVENISSILMLYMDKYLGNAQNSAVLIGFNMQESAKPDYLINSTYPAFGTTLTATELDITYEQGDYFYIPVLQQQPVVNSGYFFPESNSISGEGASLTYQFDKNWDIYKLKFSFEPLSAAYLDSAEEEDAYLPLPVNEISLYNNLTMSYDCIDFENLELSKDKLNVYLNGNNELRLKYKGDPQTGGYAPVISIIGRLNDASN